MWRAHPQPSTWSNPKILTLWVNVLGCESWSVNHFSYSPRCLGLGLPCNFATIIYKKIGVRLPPTLFYTRAAPQFSLVIIIRLYQHCTGYMYSKAYKAWEKMQKKSVATNELPFPSLSLENQTSSRLSTKCVGGSSCYRAASIIKVLFFALKIY
jgi:hypothetical protein